MPPTRWLESTISAMALDGYLLRLGTHLVVTRVLWCNLGLGVVADEGGGCFLQVSIFVEVIGLVVLITVIPGAWDMRP